MKSIAERTLTYRDGEGQQYSVVVKIGLPVADGECWACDYELEAPTFLAATAYGEDSLQALVMPLHAVTAHSNAPDLRGRVFWLGVPLGTEPNCFG